MDHIPLPRGAVHDIVPFVCRAEYDCGPFSTYALRAKPPKPQLLSFGKGNEPTFDNLERLNPTPKQYIEDFLQTWLYFGILWTFFGSQPSFRFEDFLGLSGTSPKLSCHNCSCQLVSTVHYYSSYSYCEACAANVDAVEGCNIIKRSVMFHSAVLQNLSLSAVEDNDNSAVTTAEKPMYPKTSISAHKLNLITQTWSEEMKALPPDQRDSRCEHLNECLVIMRYAWQTCATAWTLGVGEISQPIIVSIAALGEYLAGALGLVSEVKTVTSGWWQGTTLPDLNLDMKKNGHCFYDVQRIQKMRQISTIYFLSKMKLPAAGDRHNACTDTACAAFQTDPSTYVPQHKIKGCKCSMYTIDGDKMLAPLLGGSYPLLRITTEGDVKVVSAAETVIPYVAISHVWADGAGNPEKNALYQCQLRALASRINLLMRCLNGQNADKALHPECAPVAELLVWIDTLCCPVGPKKMKQLGLAKIREVYDKAAHVLVLDSTLEQEDVLPTSSLEIFAKIYLSPWSKRLWTLQEASLAKTSYLWFQFRDTPFSMAKLLRIGILVNAKRPATCNITLELHPGWWVLTNMRQDPNRQMRGFWDPNVATRRPFDVFRAASRRSVSERSDEPLCLASIFGLELEDIITLDDAEARMQIFWQQFQKMYTGISRNVIFAAVERLFGVGFRWAPKTMLHPASWNAWHEDSKAILSDKGLQVKYPAFRISRPPPLFKQPAWDWNLPEARALIVRASSATWYTFLLDHNPAVPIDQGSSISKVFEKCSEHVIILVDNDDGLEDSGSDWECSHRALLGRLSATSAGIREIVTLAVGKLHKNSSREPYESAFRCSESLRRDSTVLDIAKSVSGFEADSVDEMRADQIDAMRTALDALDQHIKRVATDFGSSHFTPHGIRGHIGRGLFEPYCLVEEVYPSTTDWCVD